VRGRHARVAQCAVSTMEGRLCRTPKAHDWQVPATGLELNVKFQSLAGPTADGHAGLRTRGGAWPAAARLESRVAIGRMPPVVHLVGRGPSEHRDSLYQSTNRPGPSRIFSRHKGTPMALVLSGFGVKMKRSITAMLSPPRRSSAFQVIDWLSKIGILCGEDAGKTCAVPRAPLRREPRDKGGRHVGGSECRFPHERRKPIGKGTDV